MLLQLYKQDVTNSCSGLDTSNRIEQFLSNKSVDCLPPGKYTLQISGSDSTINPRNTYYQSGVGSSGVCFSTSLGRSFNLFLTIYPQKGASQFSLNSPGAYDTINRVGNAMQPLVSGVRYQSQIDTFGCVNTVLPDTSCNVSANKVLYREFKVAESGVVTFENLTYRVPYIYYSLFNGDAGSMATAQSAFTYPAEINGLTLKSTCFFQGGCGGQRFCVTPGTYTLATFGTDAHIGVSDRPSITFDSTTTKHFTPQTAQDMGSIVDSLPGGVGTYFTDTDYFSCKDNAVPIAGLQPCSFSGVASTKAIYRQFYLKSTSNISISQFATCNYGYTSWILFYGKASDGLNTLAAMPIEWRCKTYPGYTSLPCSPLTPGWYTLVSYGEGPNYTNHLQGTNYNVVGSENKLQISITPACAGPKYNRPYKAAIDTITRQPFLIEWKNRVGSTTAVPKTDTTYTLYPESYNCTVDTPSQHIP